MQILVTAGHTHDEINNMTQDEFIGFIEAINELKAQEFQQTHASTAHASGNMSTDDFMKVINNV
jgi:hypothetical protein